MLMKGEKAPIIGVKMLVQFLVGNFRSIKTEQSLSLVASSDKSLASHLIETNVRVGGVSMNLLRSALIYGPNASGKSNICAAVRAFRLMVLNSATKLSVGDSIPEIAPYRLDTETNQEPSVFEVNVLLGDVVYRYGCAVTEAAVSREWLYSRKTIAKAPEVMVFERFGEDSVKWRFGASFRGNKEILRRQTRPNCLLLSKAAQDNYEIVLPLYGWFRNGLITIDMADSPEQHIFRAAVRSAEGELDGRCIGGIAQVADTTVSDVEAHVEEKEFPEEVRAILKSQGHDVPERMRVPMVTFGRPISGSDEVARFEMSEESNGSQRFFAIASLLVEAFREGKTVIIDELECSLHTILTQEIMEVLNDPELGAKGSQFIVATHDTNLLNVEKLRRDQIFLVEKGPTGATEFYSLWDVQPKPRSDASLENQYLAGRFGAVPVLGNLRLAIASAMGALKPTRVVNG